MILFEHSRVELEQKKTSIKNTKKNVYIFKFRFRIFLHTHIYMNHVYSHQFIYP